MSRTVLLIEENSPSAALVKQALLSRNDGSLVVERVRKCSEAQARLRTRSHSPIAAVVTKLFLPDSQGLETISRIFEVSPRIPILVLTNTDNEPVARQAIQRGAQDYVLQHRLDSYSLPNILQNMLYRASHGTFSTAEKTPARTAPKSLNQAVYDPLTGLPNAVLFDDRLSQAIVLACRLQSSLAVLYVDIDRLQDISDSLGHAIGDQLLQSIAGRLTASVRGSDTVCRPAGDEFALVLSGLSHAKDAGLIAARILGNLRSPHCVGTHRLEVTATIGFAVYPQDGRGARALLNSARVARSWAKARGHNSPTSDAGGSGRTGRHPESIDR